MPSVAKASPESIETFRKDVEAPLEEAKGTVDERDIARLMSDDEYAACFVQWSRKQEDAAKMVIKCFKWRHENKVNDLTVDQINDAVLKQGVIFEHGRSVSGNRILHFRTCKADKNLKEATMKLLILWLERIQRKETGKQLVFLLDNTDAGLRNSDMGFISFIIECMSTYFPCMLDRMIVYNMPTLLNSIWKLVSKMLSAEQRDSTILCSKDEIFKFIDEENALKHMGGNNTYQYSYPPFPELS